MIQNGKTLDFRECAAMVKLGTFIYWLKAFLSHLSKRYCTNHGSLQSRFQPSPFSFSNPPTNYTLCSIEPHNEAHRSPEFTSSSSSSSSWYSKAALLYFSETLAIVNRMLMTYGFNWMAAEHLIQSGA